MQIVNSFRPVSYYHTTLLLPNFISFGRVPTQKATFLEAVLDQPLRWSGDLIAEMVESVGVFKPCTSLWSSPVVLVPKDGSLRFCIDYRKLNSMTKKDVYLLPRIDDILDSLGETRYLTSLDLAAGYFSPSSVLYCKRICVRVLASYSFLMLLGSLHKITRSRNCPISIHVSGMYIDIYRRIGLGACA